MAKKDKQATESLFALSKENYKLMAIGFAIIVVGFILLAGGGSDDPNVFSEDIFNFRRLTLAPVVLLIGFIFEIYAIMKKPKQDKE
jgi:membrane-bound ClpP family serine protease